MGEDYTDCNEWKDDDPRWDKAEMIEVMRDVVTLERFPMCWLKHESFGYEGEDLENPSDCEVIGNIHDNPNLLPTTT